MSEIFPNDSIDEFEMPDVPVEPQLSPLELRLQNRCVKVDTVVDETGRIWTVQEYPAQKAKEQTPKSNHRSVWTGRVAPENTGSFNNVERYKG